SYENKVEQLNIHDYDSRIQNNLELKSISNTFEGIENFEEENYLNNFIILVIADWLEQINIRTAISLRMKKRVTSGIPENILNLIPMI
ncbi:18843_t:CDS:2, partial [Funneliformis geosporum]